MSEPTGAPAPVAQPPAAVAPGLSQEQVNAIVKRESDAAQARGIAAAQAEMEKALGMSVAEVAEFVKAKQAQDDANKSEAEKAVAAAAKATNEATQATTSAAAEVFGSRAEIALIRAGLALPESGKDEDIASVLGRVRGMLTVAVGSTAAEIAADVAALKVAFPGLFAAAGTVAPPPPGTDPKTPGKKTNGTVTGLAAGLAKGQAASSTGTPPALAAWGRPSQ